MTFLNPLILFGLAAVSIPILIHLLNLSKVRKIEFSTLRFLKELQKSKMRRIKLRQLILLALRILAIAFLVLGFADPVLKGSGGSYSGASGAVIILDNSFSMSADGGRVFLNAKEAVRGILKSLGGNREIYFVRNSDIGNSSAELLSVSGKEASEKLERSEISLKPFSFNEAVMTAAGLFENSANSTGDLFIVTDNQAVNYSGTGGLLLPDPLRKVNLYVVNSGKDDLGNISIDSGFSNSGTVIAGMESKADFMLHNYSKFGQANTGVKFFLNGSYSGESFTDLGTNESKETDLSFKTDNTGSNTGEAQLTGTSESDDQLKQDNSEFIAFRIPEKIRVNIVSGSSSESAYPEIALRTSQSLIASETGRSSELHEITKSEITDNSLNNSDVLIIAGRRSMSSEESESVAEFVKRGGGVIFFPSSEAEPASFNDNLFGLAGNLRLSDKVTFGEEAEKSFSDIDFDHPLLKGVFRNKGLNLTSGGEIAAPLTKEYFRILLSDKVKPIIRFPNSDPFLSEVSAGKGKLIVFSMPLSSDAGDLGASSIFVPLLTRSVNYLSSNLELHSRYEVGRQNIVKLTGISRPVRITNPKGESDTLGFPQLNSGSAYFMFPYTNFSSLPGIYTLADSAGSTSAFALNHSAGESNLLRIDKSMLLNELKVKGFSSAEFSEWNEIEKSYLASKNGRQLWPYFILLALAALAIEKFYSRKLERGEA